jgi:hypothetical protein
VTGPLETTGETDRQTDKISIQTQHVTCPPFFSSFLHEKKKQSPRSELQ